MGYDADVQTYFFKDRKGTLWSSKERHGVMQPGTCMTWTSVVEGVVGLVIITMYAGSLMSFRCAVQKKRREKAKDASMDEAAVDSDDEATLVYISDEELDGESSM